MPKDVGTMRLWDSSTGAGASDLQTGAGLGGVVQLWGDCILLTGGGVDGGVVKVGKGGGAPLLVASLGGHDPLASGGGTGSGGAWLLAAKASARLTIWCALWQNQDAFPRDSK